MRARCLHNRLDGISSETIRRRLRRCVHIDGEIDSLKIDSIYDILALTRSSNGEIRIFIDTGTDVGFPSPFPIEFFEIVDCSIPVGWVVGWYSLNDSIDISILSFSEWVSDCRFYEKLIEGDSNAVAAYTRNRNA